MTDLHALLAGANISLHVCAAGAGYELLRRLTAEPGASAYLSGATFPYSAQETDRLLGFTPKSYVSAETALDLAMAAYMQACPNRWGGKEPVGVGITAALATGRKLKGGERAFLAVIAPHRLDEAIYLAWDAGDEHPTPRGAQDGEIADHVELMLSDALHMEDYSEEDNAQFMKKAFARIDAHPLFQFDGTRIKRPEMIGGALMPGAFNPPHAQHFAIKEEVEHRFGEYVTFHLETTAPNKPPLSLQDVLKRLALLRGYTTLVTRGLPLYIDRARAYPDTPLVLGTDALDRMLDPKWGPPIGPMLVEFSQLGTTFYVSPRIIDGEKLTLAAVLDRHHVDPELAGMFVELESASELSSTELRKASGSE